MKRFVLSSLMIAGLAACGQTTTTTPTVDTTAKAPAQVLGFAAVTFTDVNTDHMTVSVKTSSVEDGIAGLSAQTLSRPANVTIAQGAARGAFQDGSRRWMYATLSVSNGSTGKYKNVTLSGVNIPGSFLYDTSLYGATTQGGSTVPVTQAQARDIIPVNTRVEDPGTGLAVISNLKADFQVYDELYNQNITDFMVSRYVGTAFPFGFVARNVANKSGSREIPVGNNTGQVSVAFAANDSTPLNQNDDVRTFTFIGLITADSVTTASADKYEADLSRACTAVTAFGGTTAHGFNGQGTGGCLNEEFEMPGLRISGTQATPTTVITYP